MWFFNDVGPFMIGLLLSQAQGLSGLDPQVWDAVSLVSCHHNKQFLLYFAAS